MPGLAASKVTEKQPNSLRRTKPGRARAQGFERGGRSMTNDARRRRLMIAVLPGTTMLVATPAASYA